MQPKLCINAFRIIFTLFIIFLSVITCWMRSLFFCEVGTDSLCIIYMASDISGQSSASHLIGPVSISDSPCEICCRQSDNGRGFLSQYFGFTISVHSTNTVYSPSSLYAYCEKAKQVKRGKIQRKKCFIGQQGTLDIVLILLFRKTLLHQTTCNS